MTENKSKIELLLTKRGMFIQLQLLQSCLKNTKNPTSRQTNSSMVIKSGSLSNFTSSKYGQEIKNPPYTKNIDNKRSQLSPEIIGKKVKNLVTLRVVDELTYDLMELMLGS